MKGAEPGVLNCNLILHLVRGRKNDVLALVRNEGCLQALLPQGIVDVHHHAILGRGRVYRRQLSRSSSRSSPEGRESVPTAGCAESSPVAAGWPASHWTISDVKTCVM